MISSGVLSPAVFIDRDGVIIHNRPQYVRTLKQVIVYPRSIQALARLETSRYKIIIVTNQAVVGKGLISAETAAEINRRVVEAITSAGGRVDGLYFCPHRAQDECDCRKPKPGLLVRAAGELGIDLAASYMIGDALTDIAAGQRAGVKQAILVLTGRGRKQRELGAIGYPSAEKDLSPFVVKRSLAEAVEMILKAR